MRPIVIEIVLNGFKVQVGCQTVVFNSKAQLYEALESYIRNPGETEQRFLRDSINSNVFGGGDIAGEVAGNMPERERLHRELDIQYDRQRGRSSRENEAKTLAGRDPMGSGTTALRG